MVIEKNLPFECCETCENFIVDAEEQVIFAEGQLSIRVLTVGCKNAWLCKQLKKQIEGEENGSSTL